jgi:hypothetical protein
MWTLRHRITTSLLLAPRVAPEYNGQQMGVMHAKPDNHAAQGGRCAHEDEKKDLPGSVKFGAAHRGRFAAEREGGAQLMVKEGRCSKPQGGGRVQHPIQADRSGAAGLAGEMASSM